MIIFQHLKLNLNEVKVFIRRTSSRHPTQHYQDIIIDGEEIKAAEKMRGVMLAVRPLLIEGVVYQPFLCYCTLLLGIP